MNSYYKATLDKSKSITIKDNLMKIRGKLMIESSAILEWMSALLKLKSLKKMENS